MYLLRKNRRKTTTCHNCGHFLSAEANYCEKCGQENHDLKIPIKHLIYEFVENITHFDNKLWATIKDIITSPGAISKDFLEGKRQKHVHPVRYYVFVSAIFFILINIFIVKPAGEFENKDQGQSFLSEDFDKVHHFDLASFDGLPDSTLSNSEVAKGVKFVLPIDSLLILKQLATLKTADDTILDTVLRYSKLPVTTQNRTELRSLLATIPDTTSIKAAVRGGFFNIKIGSLDELKSIKSAIKRGDQKAVDSLYNKSEDGSQLTWFERALLHQSSKVIMDEKDSLGNILQNAAKRASVLLFILMPFVAFLLYWFYRRQNRYFYEHLIFSVHLHGTAFLFWSVIMTISYLLLHEVSDYFLLLGILGMWFYTLFSLKRVYGQGWPKTWLKFALLSGLYGISLAIFLIASFLWSFLTF